jgi:1,4-dihydroxy-2-naphthoate octaprenyltransferase
MWWAGVAAGCYSCALLVVNNLRDIPGDTVSGKRTLAVRIGDARTRSFFQLLFVAAALVIVTLSLGETGPWALLGLCGVAAALQPISVVRGGASGRDLIAVLGGVGRAQLVFGVTFAVGLFIAYS